MSHEALTAEQSAEVAANIELAYKFARRYRFSYLTKDEVEAAAMYGLIIAVQTYRHTDCMLSTVAWRRMRSAAIRDNTAARCGGRIPLGTALNVLFSKYPNAKAKAAIYAKRTPYTEVTVTNSTEETGSGLAAKRELRALVRAEINKLPIVDAMLTTRRWLYERSLKDIAKEAGISRQRVAQRVDRAKLQLQDQILARINVRSSI